MDKLLLRGKDRNVYKHMTFLKLSKINSNPQNRTNIRIIHINAKVIYDDKRLKP